MTRSKWLCMCLLCFAVFSPSASGQIDDQSGNRKYDPDLAKKLGADEFGMKRYVLVMLKTGTAEIDDPQKSKELFAGHFANMSRLAKEDKLVLAGPLGNAGPRRGIFILNVTTVKEAEELVKTDPAVKAGLFEYDLMELYASAALMKINGIHSTIQKSKIE